jgi:hypothetical protein
MSIITEMELNKSALQIAACEPERPRAAWDYGAARVLNSAVSVDTIGHFTREDEKIDLCVLLDGYDPGPAIGSTQAEFRAPEARFEEPSIDMGGQLDVCPGTICSPLPRLA